MGLFLQVLGAGALLFFLFLVVAIVFIRFKIKGFLKELKSAVEDFETTTKPKGAPARITLVPVISPTWDDEETAEHARQTLAKLGFEKAGNYEVEEIPGFQLEAWVNSARSIASVIYEHTSLGVWVDFWTHFQDGTRVTFANASHGSGVDHAPGHDVQRFPDMDVEELFNKFIEYRRDAPTKSFTVENFVTIFEKTYADEQDWRNSRGGPSHEEVKNVLAISGETYEDEMIDAVHEKTESQALEQLDEAFRENFLAKSKLDPERWERFRDRVIFIHDKLTQGKLNASLGPFYEEDGLPSLEDSGEHTPRVVVAAFNDQLADGQKMKKIGTLKEPLYADVYLLPEI